MKIPVVRVSPEAIRRIDPYDLRTDPTILHDPNMIDVGDTVTQEEHKRKKFTSGAKRLQSPRKLRWQTTMSSAERLLYALKPKLSPELSEHPRAFHDALSRALVDIKHGKLADANKNTKHHQEWIEILSDMIHDRDWVGFCRNALQEG
jgi:hypothetical protein